MQSRPCCFGSPQRGIIVGQYGADETGRMVGSVVAFGRLLPTAGLVIAMMSWRR
jgi:hypothetical protein